METAARQAFEDLLLFCAKHDGPFRPFETKLLQRLFALGCLLVRLFLAIRHERLAWLDQTPPQGYRPGDPEAERTLKTLFGPVTYQRVHLIRKEGGSGYHPLDVELGLTRDGFSPWVIQFVTRLATRMSFAASRLLCRSVLGWSPSTEAIEELVLGLGRQAQPFMQQQVFHGNASECRSSVVRSCLIIPWLQVRVLSGPVTEAEQPANFERNPGPTRKRC